MENQKELNVISYFLREVASVSGTIAKEQTLATVIENKKYGNLVKEVLYFAFNPYIKTRISSKKFSKSVSVGAEKEIKSLMELMEYLKESRGNNVNIATVQEYYNNYAEDECEQWLVKSLVCKSLKIGATATTINKAIGYALIPQFEIMLAEKWMDYDKKKGREIEHWKGLVGKNVIATLKIDGNRAEVFVNDDGSVKIFSREGHELEGYVEIEEACLEAERGYVYEGEFLYIDETGKMDSNEKFLKTSSIMRSKGVKRGLEFIVFDIIPIDSFTNAEVDKQSTCTARKNTAKQFVSEIDSPIIRYLEPLYEGIFDKERLDVLAEELKLMGEEGLMVQCADSPYEYKRVKHLLKYKSFESCDIKCVGVYEGKSGENIGRLGGIVCEYKGDPVKVGIGFSSEQRDKFWLDPSEIIGKIVEIKFFQEFISDDGSYDLRFASFKDIREDKTEESYY